MSTYDVILKELQPQLVAGIRTMLPNYRMIGSLFEELFAHLGRYGVGGLAVGLHHQEPDTEHDVDVEVAVYLDRSIPQGGRVTIHTLPGGTVVTTLYKGPWTEIGDAYTMLMTWIDAKGYQICGPSRELYLHLGATPDSHMTEIQIPVQRR